MKKITLFILLISSITYAQTGQPTETNSSKIKVYTPSSSSVSAADNSYKWTVKTDLLSFVSGELPIIGEYRVGKKFGAEVSLGATYGILDLSDYVDEEGSTFETKSKFGTSFRAGMKYYPSSDYDAIEGWAFGLQFFTRTNKKEYVADSYYDVDVTFGEDSRTKTGLALTISKQVFGDSNISFEYLIGLGFAKVKHDFLTSAYDSNNSNYILIPNSTSETVPNLQLGCRIGFGN